MKKCTYVFIFFAVLIMGCKTVTNQSSSEKLINYVNPFIGVDRGGNQSPGPLYPFGMMRLSPINIPQIDPASYVAGKTDLFGVGLINMVGTGCSNFSNVLILPETKMPDFSNESLKILSDTATVGWYSCKLQDNISLEMTGLTRSGILKIDFGKNQSKFLKIDLTRRNTDDSAFYLKKENGSISGYRDDGQFCGKPGDTRVYFYIKIPTIKSDAIVLVKNGIDLNENELEVKMASIGAKINLSDEKSPIELRIGISFVSIENAKLNLEQEIANKNFQEVVNENQGAWEKLLSRILVEGGTKDDKIKFYTAIFHTMSHPNILNDVNGEYPAMETLKKMKSEQGNRYTLYSLWDTYRNLHPFMSLVYPEMQSDMVKSMLNMYDEYGWLPHWECFSKEKGVMNGDPACIVINDTYLRGIRDFDAEKAFKAMVHNSKVVYKVDKERDRSNVEYVRKAVKPYWDYKGYIPADYRRKGGDVWGTVAATLEYNLSDWNIAQMAQSLGNTAEYNTYLNISKGWKTLFDAQSGFIRQRNSDGTWVDPFNDKETSGEMPWPGSGGPGYVEGNAHNYNFFVPHDMKELINMLGGQEKFTSRLQSVFDNKLYEATNEPDLAYPFLFNYAKGEEWRTQKTVRDLIEKEYNTGFDGIPGNDDTGTMSAWLIFAMMGLYPDCPGNMDYQICSPVFSKITIKLDDKYYKGKEFIIETQNGSKDNIYIKSMSLNGKEHKKFQVSHQEIVNGGKMIIELKKDK